MPHQLLDRPEHIHYSTTYRVLYSDVNTANHLAAARILPIGNEMMLDFIRALGFQDPTNIDGSGMIMANSMTDYLGEARYSEQLIINMSVSHNDAKALDITFHFINRANNQDIAIHQCRMLFFNYESSKVVAIPGSFKQRLSDWEDNQAKK